MFFPLLAFLQRTRSLRGPLVRLLLLVVLLGGLSSRTGAQTPGLWKAFDIATSNGNDTRLIWLTPDNGFQIWNLSNSGAKTLASPVFAPASWVPVKVGVAGDGTTRVLIRRSDGAAAVWGLDANLNLSTSTPAYGPYAGWTPIDMAVARDGSLRLLWTTGAGQASMWNIDTAGTVSIAPTFGPFTDGAGGNWNARRIAVGGDGLVRLLWTTSGGQASLWTLDSALNRTAIAPTFGPYVNTQVLALAMDTSAASSNKIHMLWPRSDGAATFWRLGADNATLEINTGFGPYAGWTAQALSMGGDGQMRALWANTDGHAAFWKLSADGTTFPVNVTYGPLPQAAPTNLTATPGNAQVSLSWTAAANATSYSVKSSTNAGGPYTTLATGVTTTNYTDTGLTNGTTYYYVVSATGGGADSPFSNEASASPVAPPPTPAPIPTPGATPAPNAITAQSSFATSAKSAPVLHVLSFPAQQAGQSLARSFPVTLSSKQLVNITDFSASPSSAATDLMNSMKVYNAAGQVIQDGAASQISNGGDAHGTPATVEFTSNSNTPVSVSVNTRTVDQKGIFNLGSSDPTKAPKISGKSFTLRGHLTYPSPTYVEGVGFQNDVSSKFSNVHLRAGESLMITSGNYSFHDQKLSSRSFSCKIYSSSVSHYYIASLVNWIPVSPFDLGPGNSVDRYFVAPSEDDYTIVLSVEGNSHLDIPTGKLTVWTGYTDYKINFKTSFAPHAPGHGAHPTSPNKAPKQNPQMGGASAPCPGPGGCGPLSGDPVDLSTGQESYSSGEDLSIYNPSGPDVAFTRYYSNERAASLGSSPGLPIGWHHTYDVRLESNSAGTNWPPMDLVYPNGARETLVPKVDANKNLVLDGNGQAQFVTPVGSTYLVTATPSATGKTYSTSSVTWNDGTVWNFATPAGNSDKALLFSIVAPTSSSSVPQYLTFQWAGDDRDDYRLMSVCNGSDGRALLALGYTGDPSNGYLLTQISDPYGRSIYYANGTLSGATNVPTLTGVSMIAYNGAAAPQHYAFGYVNFSGSPFLGSITVPHPNDASQTATASINYGTDGRVSNEVDGNGNATAFTYGAGQTLVQTLNTANVVETQYTSEFDSQGRDIGTLDAENNPTYISYGDANNPDKPTRVTDAASRTTTIVYEPNGLGLVSALTSPRGVTTHYGYNYGVWPFGLLSQTWQSTGSGTALVNHPPTTLTYLPGYERAGLVSQIDSPHPNVGAPGWTGATTVSSYLTYNAFGDVTSVTTPGHNGTSSLSTTLNYTTDGTSYSQNVARGQVVSVSDPTGAVSSFRYDARGNKYGTRDALNHVSTASYDLADNPTSQTLPATGQTGSGASYVTLAYNYLGGMLKTSNSYDESGSGTPFRSVTTNYDAEGRTLSVGGATEPVAYTYTSFGAPKTLGDGSGHTTSYSYNLRGLLTQIVRPLGNAASGLDVVKFTNYAPDGQLLSETDGRGVTTQIAHQDPDGEVSSITLPDETITLGRDSWGRLTGRSDASGSQTYSFSDADALLSTTTSYQRADGTALPALTLANQYEADGTRSGLYGPTGSPTAPINLSYGFDARGSLTQLNDNAQSLISRWSYDAGARLSGAGAANGWSRGYTYNALNQVLALTQSKAGQGSLNFGHPTDPSQQLRYDGQGNMVRETATTSGAVPSTVAGTTIYGYDGNDRLTGENSNRFSSYGRTYSLDAAYNRIGATGVSGTSASWSRTFSGNANNQVTGFATTQAGVTTSVGYTYDGEGNRSSLTSNGTTTFYGYDSQQRLTAVTQSVNGAAATMVMKAGYRADGLRAWKENAQGRTYFLYDGSQLVGEFDSSGVMQVSQTWGAEGLAYRRTASGASAGTRFYSWDVRGNIAMTTDSNGAVVNTPSSDGFSSSGGVEPCATFGGQVGGYRDNETGLVLFGQRYYDQGLGSWLTRDPIGEEGGVNLYCYVSGNPTNDLDPDGLAPQLPPRIIVPRTNGWSVEHFYHAVEHGPAHAHLLGPNGENIQITVTGKAWKGEQEIPSAARKVIKNNMGKIREAVNACGKWLENEEMLAAEAKGAAAVARLAQQRVMKATSRKALAMAAAAAARRGAFIRFGRVRPVPGMGAFGKATGLLGILDFFATPAY